MNPRVSRSSALASKATGFPIAKIAALLAVGYRLDEITNDITGETPASFEPTLDYVVVKIPRFAFEKFSEADPRPHVHDEVGGRGDGDRPHVQGGAGQGLARPGEVRLRPGPRVPRRRSRAITSRRSPTAPRDGCIWSTAPCARAARCEEVADASKIDPWFVDQIAQTVERVQALERAPAVHGIGRRAARRQARGPLGRARSPLLTGGTEAAVRRQREALGVVPVFKTVDTCGGEFPARTPYHFSTYEDETEVTTATRPRVVILGAGPNRIGQGIEFDYACVHAAFALEEAGFESVMVNSNPETVSTDYDTSSRLYFESLSAEDVLAVCRAERPVGVIAQLGGQTPLRLAGVLQEEGFAILGTSPDAIDLAEDRGKFAQILDELDIPAPPHGEARTMEEARAIAASDRLPGGRATVLRPGRPGDGDRVRRARPGAVRANGRRGLARSPGADRPVPRGRDRGGRRRRVRRGRRRLRRRRDGAHRGGRRALGRLLVPDPARHAERRRAGRDRGHHAPARAPPRRRGPAEPSARRQGRADLGPGGEPARVAYRAVRVQGHRRVAGAHGHARARRAARSPSLAAEGVLAVGPASLPAPALHQREGGRAAVRPLPRRRHRAGPRDEVHRRGDGHRRRLGHGPGEGDGRRRAMPFPRAARYSSASRTATSARSCSPRSAWRTWASVCSRPAGPRACCNARASRWSGSPR